MDKLAALKAIECLIYRDAPKDHLKRALQTYSTALGNQFSGTGRVSLLYLTPTIPTIYQVARIVRIVLNDGGHALLVGVGGSGKQSLSRLAAFICGYSVSQIVISSTYSINDLKEDLKTMYNKVSACPHLIVLGAGQRKARGTL